MSDDFFAEIQESFLQEASDLLISVEALSLRVEKNEGRESAFEELARLAHNFKGSGKAVGFEHISKFGHRIEDLILGIKNGKITPRKENLNVLFKCLDRLQKDIQELMKDRNQNLSHDSFISEIDHALSGAFEKNSDVAAVAVQDMSAAQHTLVPQETFSAVNSSNRTEVMAEELSPAQFTSPQISETPQPEKESTRAASKKNETIRITRSKIDYLLECFGEQVILQSTLEQHKYDLGMHSEIILKTISQLTKLTFELQSHALSLSMVPLGPTFTKLERAIRDAAVTIDKQIDVQFIGADTEIDKNLIDSLSDALTHMVRNAVDHGIEDAATRIERGKSAVGHLKVGSRRVGSQIWFEIQDDGQGLDHKKLVDKAVRQNLLSAADAERLSIEDRYKLIFRNGFSTKEQVSEISGRGVGMNVVEESVSSLKGEIEIQSELGKGTLFRLKLPLTLSIFNGALIRVNEHKFIVPTSEITEISKIQVTDHVDLGHRLKILKIRDDVYELIDLRQKFKSCQPKTALVVPDKLELPVLLSRKQKKIAYLVDEILGMQKVVLRPVGEEIKSKGFYTAATILGDGSPGVILNLGGIQEAA